MTARASKSATERKRCQVSIGKRSRDSTTTVNHAATITYQLNRAGRANSRTYKVNKMTKTEFSTIKTLEAKLAARDLRIEQLRDQIKLMRDENIFLRQSAQPKSEHVKEANLHHLNAAIGVLKNVRCSDNKDHWGVTKREISDICASIKLIAE